ncbi:MAG TPA: dTMP kinase [Solirubrobacteraceae bacterium]|nr:dTMP kinase [Solirubrobacteraceae bacterium]
MATGRLITIEGLDGAGKSTLARGLVRECERRGRRVELLREPGGVELSERLRAIVKDGSLSIDARAEALIYAAARAQLVAERLRPLLRAGELVLVDRFVDSSLAYQGVGRGLGVEEVGAINAFATGGLRPERTLLLALSPGQARARLEGRAAAGQAMMGAGAGVSGEGRDREEGPDRLEREGEGFFAAIAGAYQELARREPERIRVLDGTLPEDRVLNHAMTAIEDLL